MFTFWALGTTAAAVVVGSTMQRIAARDRARARALVPVRVTQRKRR
jgi:hypothetical protein